MNKNCILYLVRTSKEDLDSLNQSLMLLENNVLPFCKSKIDIILFHEESFDETYQTQVKTSKYCNIIFVKIEFKVPNYSKEIMGQIPEFYPHPTHAKGGPHGESYFKEHGHYHPGFSMGYRHMCRFFTGWMYEQEILKNYEYYLRLDTDSFIHSPVKYDFFEWMKTNMCEYGFISQAIQQDNPNVIIGLWNTVKTWIYEKNIQTKIDINQIPDGKMFYTNFELGKVSSFIKGSLYFDFYKYIDLTGGIYTKRWGDAPLKFLGVNLFINPNAIKSVSGFVYQHGAIYSI